MDQNSTQAAESMQGTEEPQQLRILDTESLLGNVGMSTEDLKRHSNTCNH